MICFLRQFCEKLGTNTTALSDVEIKSLKELRDASVAFAKAASSAKLEGIDELAEKVARVQTAFDAARDEFLAVRFADAETLEYWEARNEVELALANAKDDAFERVAADAERRRAALEKANETIARLEAEIEKAEGEIKALRATANQKRREIFLKRAEIETLAK